MGVRMWAENSGHKEMTSRESVSQHFHKWDSPTRSHGHQGGSKKSFGTLFERVQKAWGQTFSVPTGLRTIEAERHGGALWGIFFER